MMQNGQQKSKKLTPEERLAEVERKYGVIQERIQAYDRVLDEFKRLESKLVLLEGGHQGHAELLKSHEERANELNSSLRAVQKESQQNIDAVASRVNFSASVIEQAHLNLDRKIADVQADIVNRQAIVQGLASSISNVSSSVNQKLDALQAQVASVGKVIDGHEKGLQQHHNLIAQMRMLIEDASNFDKNYRSSLDQIREEMGKGDAILNAKLQLLEDATKAEAQKTKTELQASVKAAKDEVIGTPSSNASVRAEITKQLEMNALDSANAYAKASNLEQTVKILEKKFENLTLLVKKNELATK